MEPALANKASERVSVLLAAARVRRQHGALAPLFTPAAVARATASKEIDAEVANEAVFNDVMESMGMGMGGGGKGAKKKKA